MLIMDILFFFYLLPGLEFNGLNADFLDRNNLIALLDI